MVAAEEYIADLSTTLVGPRSASSLMVLLHGFTMRASDLAPFGHSLGLPGLYLFPQAELQAGPGGRTWWPVDVRARDISLRRGPRDLAAQSPAGLPAARQLLDRYLAECRRRFQPQRLVVGGFSQGGMLACDWLLHCDQRPDALVLLSASRLDFAEWEPRAAALHGLPTFISHGRQDTNLSLEAGEKLREFALSAGATVSWMRFEGGHEVPLPVWRALRAFLMPIMV